VQTVGLHLAPLGAVVIGGWSQNAAPPKDRFLAALHQQSVRTCFGDGSDAPCPWRQQLARSDIRPDASLGREHWSAPRGPGIASGGSDSLRFVAETPPTRSRAAPSRHAIGDGIAGCRTDCCASAARSCGSTTGELDRCLRDFPRLATRTSHHARRASAI
jgi:hypothetical protein